MTKSSNLSPNISSNIKSLQAIAKSVLIAKREVETLLIESGVELIVEPVTQDKAEYAVIQLFNKFHTVACTLKRRHAGKPTLEIEDEKDAQDLFHALLWTIFERVKREEPLESVAGGGTFMDFLLPDPMIGIELKMGYKKKVALRKEINDDKANYKTHSECSKLLVFIYDPNNEVEDPRTFERDLSEEGKMITRVFVINH